MKEKLTPEQLQKELKKLTEEEKEKILTFNDLTLSDTDNVGLEEIRERAMGVDPISLLTLDHLTSDKKLKKVSRIKEKQVVNLTKLYAFTNIFSTDLTEIIANNILSLQISLGGAGRKEMVRIAQQSDSVTEVLEPPVTKRGLFR